MVQISNTLDLKRRLALKRAFAAGLSIREAADYAGCSQGTALRYRGLYPYTCACGKGYSEHHGFCKERYKRSPVRQAFMRKWRKRKEVPGARPCGSDASEHKE